MITILTKKELEKLIINIQHSADTMMVMGRAINAVAYCIAREDVINSTVTDGAMDHIECPVLSKLDIMSLLEIMAEQESIISEATDTLHLQICQDKP